MKTGIELITKEREEQIKKHGYTQEHDDQHKDGALINAAIFAITLRGEWRQKGWEIFEAKMLEKSYDKRIIVAGALIAAEIDRLRRALPTPAPDEEK